MAAQSRLLGWSIFASSRRPAEHRRLSPAGCAARREAIGQGVSGGVVFGVDVRVGRVGGGGVHSVSLSRGADQKNKQGAQKKTTKKKNRKERGAEKTRHFVESFSPTNFMTAKYYLVASVLKRVFGFGGNRRLGNR